MNNKVLIIGNSGMLGKDLSKVFKEDGACVIGLDKNKPVGNNVDRHYEIDLCDEIAVLNIMESEKPDLILYAAAIVDLDFCETNKSVADRIHIYVPEIIAKNKKDLSKFYYISTDSVFDGKMGDYTETDTTNPLNHYSLSKHEGEKRLLNIENCLIIRTNIYGFNIPLRNSLAEWAITNFNANKKIVGFDDVIFNAIYTYDLAILINLISKKNINGILNIACKGSWSKYDFLRTLAEKLEFSTDLVEKGYSNNFDFKIKRPLRTHLKTEKIENLMNIPSIEESIDNFCKRIKDSQL